MDRRVESGSREEVKGKMERRLGIGASGGSGSGSGGGGFGKGHMSKRFDGRDEMKVGGISFLDCHKMKYMNIEMLIFVFRGELSPFFFLSLFFPSSHQPTTPDPQPEIPGPSTGNAEEDAKIQAIMKEQEYQWDLQQEDLST